MVNKGKPSIFKASNLLYIRKGGDLTQQVQEKNQVCQLSSIYS